ncbi:MAG TPA: diguanylate cyclase [Telluria sp.]|nr:diguanylate cyclase [Telluria sp.]
MHLIKRPVRLRTALALLATVCVLPGLLLSSLAAWRDYQRAYEQVLANESAAARSVSATVDRDIANVVSVLATLRHSSYLKQGDMRRFLANAAEVLPSIPSARDIYLTDTHGQHLVNTSVPFGRRLPVTGNRGVVERVVRTREPAVSDVFTGALTGQLVVSVGVPVFDDDGEVIGVLFASLSSARLAALLRDEQMVPKTWIVSVHDRSGRFIARSRDHERFIGQLGSRDLLAHMLKHKEGTLEGHTREGILVVAAYTASELTGWAVAIGAPKEDLLAELHRHLALTLAGGVLTIAIGVIAARALSLMIANAVSGLRAQAEQLASWDEVQPAVTPVADVNELSQTLAHVSTVLAKTRHAAQHDPLTGLANRNLMQEILDLQLNVARRSERPLAFLYIDLDGFKQVNDRLGHQAGDEVLRAAAARMRTLLRASDCAARLGGDEFAVILIDTDAHGAQKLAERMLDELAKPIVTGLGEAQVSGSIGIALYPYSAQDTSDLIFRADEAMYQAKAAGKNRYALQVGALVVSNPH